MRNKILYGLLLVIFIFPFTIKAYNLEYGGNPYVYNGSGYGNTNVRITNCTGNITCSQNGNSITVRVASNKCLDGVLEFSFTAVNGQTSTKTVDFVTKETWKHTSIDLNTRELKNVRVASANEAWEGRTSNPSGSYHYSDYYHRCGVYNPGTSDDIPKTNSACYCNTPSIEKGSLCSYMNDGGDSVHRYKVSGVNESGCKPPEDKKENPPGVCERNRIKENSSSLNSNVCENTDEEKVKLVVEDELCDPENPYYKIETKQEFLVIYDMNKDGKIESVLELKSGESFAFDVNIKSKKKSKGTFYSGMWLADYEPLEKEYIKLKNELEENGVHDFGAAKIDKARKKTDAAKATLDSAQAELASTPYYSWVCETIKEKDGKEIDVYCDNSAEIRSLELKVSAARVDYEKALKYQHELEAKSARMYQLDAMMETLEQIVKYYQKTYVDMTYVDENEPEVKLEILSYKSKGILYSDEINYKKNEKKSEDGEINRKLLPSPGVPKLYKRTARETEVKTWDYDYNNYDSPRIRYMIPEEKQLDAITGEINITSIKKPVDGHNRVYTTKKNVDDGVYKLKISIEKLGTDNRNSEIINEMCSIDVKKTHLNYRPINVTDMTPSYITGINWINPRYGYSFRWVIRPETWSSAGSNAAT